MVLGKITHEFTAWCSKCSEWDQEAGEWKKSEAIKRFKERGWMKKKGLWVCPNCLSKENEDVD